MATIEKVQKSRGSNSSNSSGNNIKKNDIENFVGFKPGIEACQLTWDGYEIPGITYSEKDGSRFRYRFNKNYETEKKPSRIQRVTNYPESIISTDNTCTIAEAQNMLQDNHNNAQELVNYNNRRHAYHSSRDSANDGAMSSGSEGFCEPERSNSLYRDSDSGSEMKEINSRSNSVDENDMGSFANHPLSNCQKRDNGSLDYSCGNTDYSNTFKNKTEGDVFDMAADPLDIDIPLAATAKSTGNTASKKVKTGHSSESQQSGDEYQMYFYDARPKATDDRKKKDKNEEPNYFAGLKSVDAMQDVSYTCIVNICSCH